MFNYLLKLILVFALLFHLACKCRLVDCVENAGHVQLQLMRDGKNAVYGPDAYIEKDAIKIFILSEPLLDDEVTYLDDEQALSIYIREAFPVILEINGIRIDTFSLTTEIDEIGECCTSFLVTSVHRNDQIICEGECAEIIQVEI